MFQLQIEFKGKLKRKEQVTLESKIKNIRFISELTKFKVFPANYALIDLKKMLDDFSPFNVELASTMLECCGRFLYRTPLTHERTANLLEIMMRKKNALHLDNRLVMLVENAYYSVSALIMSSLFTFSFSLAYPLLLLSSRRAIPQRRSLPL